MTIQCSSRWRIFASSHQRKPKQDICKIRLQWCHKFPATTMTYKWIAMFVIPPHPFFFHSGTQAYCGSQRSGLSSWRCRLTATQVDRETCWSSAPWWARRTRDDLLASDRMTKTNSIRTMRRCADGPTTDTRSSSRCRSMSSAVTRDFMPWHLWHDEFISKTFAEERTSIDQNTEMRLEHAALDRFSRKFPVTPCQREVSSVDDDDNKKPKFIDVHSDLDWKRYQVARPSLWTTFVASEKHTICIFWSLHQIMNISIILHKRRRKTFIFRRYYRGPRNWRYRSLLCETRSPSEDYQCFRHDNSQPNQGFSITLWLPRGWLWNVKLRVRYTFIQFAKNISSNDTFIQWHFRPDSFHPMTLSSKNGFIRIFLPPLLNPESCP